MWVVTVVLRLKTSECSPPSPFSWVSSQQTLSLQRTLADCQSHEVMPRLSDRMSTSRQRCKQEYPRKLASSLEQEPPTFSHIIRSWNVCYWTSTAIQQKRGWALFMRLKQEYQKCQSHFVPRYRLWWYPVWLINPDIVTYHLPMLLLKVAFSKAVWTTPLTSMCKEHHSQSCSFAHFLLPSVW